MKILTVDGGITTTRAAVFEKDKIISFAKEEVGVRQTHLTASKHILKQGVKRVINKVLQKARLKGKRVDYLFASGMITSNLGLFEVPHIQAPITLQKQAKAVIVKLLKDVFPIPFHFIPGVACHTENVKLDSLSKVDFMRGEETEIRGILYLKKTNLPAIFILPGSHTKVILVDKTGAIVESATLITGEIIKAIMNQTIIGNSLPKNLVSKIDRKFFLKGAQICSRYGLTKALFCIRILEQLAKSTPNQIANFFMGAVLTTDLSGMKQFFQKARETALGGHKNLKQLYGILLKEENLGKVTVLSDEISKHASSFGALQIAQIWLKKQKVDF